MIVVNCHVVGICVGVKIFCKLAKAAADRLTTRDICELVIDIHINIDFAECTITTKLCSHSKFFSIHLASIICPMGVSGGLGRHVRGSGEVFVWNFESVI